jgi:hypothetical protein
MEKIFGINKLWKSPESAIPIINLLKYKIGIEIGVQAGRYSLYILQDTKVEKLFGVDNYQNKPIKENNFYQAAIKKTSSFSDRYKLIISDSVEASKTFPEGYFDFIYIDADHSYKAVNADIVAWWPKLKPCGLFYGHDYFFEEKESLSFGVPQAVDEFAVRESQEVRVSGTSSLDIDEKHFWARKNFKSWRPRNKEEEALKDIQYALTWWCFKDCIVEN